MDATVISTLQVLNAYTSNIVLGAFVVTVVGIIYLCITDDHPRRKGNWHVKS